MRHRFPTAALAALAATLLLAGAALAGGWANAVMDEPPQEPPSAGEPITIGFTLLQHGIAPVDHGSTNVTVTNPDTGQAFTVAARQEGASGHWVAVITFPTEGTWRYSVATSDPEIGPLEVGMKGFNPVTVGVAGPGAPTSPATSAATAQPLTWLLVAVILALAVVGTYFLARRRRSGLRTVRA